MRIAIAVFPDAEELDVVGPWEVLSYWVRNVAPDGCEIALAGPSREPVTCAKGMQLVPQHTLDDLGPLDLFVLPGGVGTRAFLAEDEPLHTTLRDLHTRGTLLASVCTGSLVFAAAGLLRNRPATTYWDCLDLLKGIDSTIDVRGDDRFVDDGDIVTSAGVSAGIDMALHLVARLDGVDAARAVRKGIQYDPEPPV
jgi:transcriptional regulator GlxA family with amidase domain